MKIYGNVYNLPFGDITAGGNAFDDDELQSMKASYNICSKSFC